MRQSSSQTAINNFDHKKFQISASNSMRGGLGGILGDPLTTRVI